MFSSKKNTHEKKADCQFISGLVYIKTFFNKLVCHSKVITSKTECNALNDHFKHNFKPDSTTTPQFFVHVKPVE